MLFGGNGTLNQHPRPLRRKTSALDGYYKNGIPVTTVRVGDTITYDVPGPYSPGQVYLVQTVDGVQIYNGPFTLPMAPYTLNVNDRTGTYFNTVYSKAPSAGGFVIETDTATLLPAPASPYTQPTVPAGPPPTTVPVTPVITPTSTPVAQPVGTKTTTTRTTSSGGGGNGGGIVFDVGGGGAPQPPLEQPDNTLLIAGLAALAFVMLS